MRCAASAGLLAALVLATASAATVAPIPGKGNSLSFLHQIIDVHTAKSPMDEIRLFEVCASTCAEPTLILQVVGENRPPAGKMALIKLWTLNYGLRRVDSVSLRETTVVIEGWTYARGALSCSATFSFSELGILEDGLQDNGCVAH
jgi:hypothetical protein